MYEDAHYSRLGTEKFDLDGTHTGTGGGNHVVLGGATPADSPFLRRPDLLRSLVAYWHNHPSLSYLFSGTFIGPTSQAPRVDEGRRDARYELEIAFEQAAAGRTPPPWLVDRVFRHLLVDGTGNTHRAEFCIDKLFSPDSSTGRLGLVEFRAFEMPPHARMSLAQQLLLRACVARFWKQPYDANAGRLGHVAARPLHAAAFRRAGFPRRDRRDCSRAGYAIDNEWFAPHFEFRFPRIGEFTYANVHVELRKAIEPWYVLGEEGAGRRHGPLRRFVGRAAASESQGHDQPAARASRAMVASCRCIPPASKANMSPACATARGSRRAACTRRSRSMRRWCSTCSTSG